MPPPSSSKKFDAAAAVTGPVVRQLYRSLLKEARKLDSDPVLKVLFPLPRKLYTALGLKTQLYTPDLGLYSDVVRHAFRQDQQTKALRTGQVKGFTIELGFDTLSKIKAHTSAVGAMMPRIVREREPMMKGLTHAISTTATTTTTSGASKVEADQSIADQAIVDLQQQQQHQNDIKNRHNGAVYYARPVTVRSSSLLFRSLDPNRSKEEGEGQKEQQQPSAAAAEGTKTQDSTTETTSSPTDNVSLVEAIQQQRGLSPGTGLTPLRSTPYQHQQRQQQQPQQPGAGRFPISVGMGLVAHPLSSAHIDRRVMLVVERNTHMTTALVLDLAYTYPLSQGNSMFPEVLWEHEIHNGGFCHVDYTMPPTANVCVLHTIPPPSPNLGSSLPLEQQQQGGGNSSGASSSSPSFSSPDYSKWIAWARQKSGGAGGSGKKKTRVAAGAGAGGKSEEQQNNASSSISCSQQQELHALLCTPIIRGKQPGEPTLYYSKVETLPFLGTLIPGQLRSSVRVYWGCMRWPTAQLSEEILLGHWIPVEISPSFFGAFPTGSLQGDTTADPSSSSPSSPSSALRFPSEQELRQRREMRLARNGMDVVPPTMHPPDQPTCRREPLWDQLMFTMGGEYRSLVGAANPFVAAKQQDLGRVVVPPVPPVTDDLSRLLEGLDAATIDRGHGNGGLDDDDDDAGDGSGDDDDGDE